jgi:hypothetical protein
VAIRQQDEDTLNEGTAVTGGQSFESFADTLPESGTGFEIEQNVALPDDGEGSIIGNGPSPDEVKKMRIKMSKQMKKAMDKLKKSIAVYPKMYFSNKAKRHPEWALDEDEEALITDSITFALDILDIEFEIEALHITLTSIWWVIAYPISVIGMVFLSHSSAVKEAHPEDFQKEGE